MSVMQMPVVVGILVAVIFLVAFSEWFYHLVKGWREIVIDDAFFKYRIVGVSIFSMFIIGSSFFGMALITECPNEVREGILAKLRCEEYLKIKAGTENLFGEDNNTKNLENKK